MSWTEDQLKLLNQTYEDNHCNFFYMTKLKKHDLLNKLDVRQKIVLEWFRNKRKTDKKKLIVQRPTKRKLNEEKQTDEAKLPKK